MTEAVSPVSAAAAPAKGKSGRWVLGRSLRIVLGGSVLLALIAAGIFAPWLAPHDPNSQSLANNFRPPAWYEGGSWENPLGTDNLGRDILSRIIYGARVSLAVGLSTVLLAGGLGSLIGAVAGYYGGRLEHVIMRIADTFLAFPFLLLAIAVLAFMGSSLLNIILALVLSNWVHYCRVVRGETLARKESEYVLAARATGASDAYIIVRHILPNMVGVLTVLATFSMARMIISESSLSFLGVGVPPTIPTWGTMLAEGRNYLYTAPWLTVWPGVAIFITVLGLNLLGDGLRDLLDPKMRGR